MARSERFIVLAQFQCQECDWETEGRTTEQRYNAQTKARRHHVKTGHTIYGDIGYTVCYRK